EDIDRFQRQLAAHTALEEFAKKKDIEQSFSAFQRLFVLQNQSTQLQLQEIQGQTAILSNAVVALRNRLEEIEKKGKQSGSPRKEVYCGAMSANLVVRVPANAQVRIDGAATKSTGPERTFLTPPLLPGAAAWYKVDAEYVIDGRTYRESRWVEVHAGNTSRLDLTPETGKVSLQK